MKLAIFGVLAFVLGLGGSTGVMVMTHPVRLTAADSVLIAHADTTHAVHLPGAATAAATGEHAAAPAVHAPAPAAESTAHAAPEHAGGEAAATAAANPAVPQVKPVEPEGAVHEGRSATVPTTETYKQVGNILLNMKPAEAAKIVSYLSDEQVEGLLRSMAPRQAATVLGQLPPERAAALSKRLLAPAKEVRP